MIETAAGDSVGAVVASVAGDSVGAAEASGLAASAAVPADGAGASPTTVMVPSISGWMAQK